MAGSRPLFYLTALCPKLELGLESDGITNVLKLYSLLTQGSYLFPISSALGEGKCILWNVEGLIIRKKNPRDNLNIFFSLVASSDW